MLFLYQNMKWNADDAARFLSAVPQNADNVLLRQILNLLPDHCDLQTYTVEWRRSDVEIW